MGKLTLLKSSISKVVVNYFKSSKKLFLTTSKVVPIKRQRAGVPRPFPSATWTCPWRTGPSAVPTPPWSRRPLFRIWPASASPRPAVSAASATDSGARRATSSARGRQWSPLPPPCLERKEQDGNV